MRLYDTFIIKTAAPKPGETIPKPKISEYGKAAKGIAYGAGHMIHGIGKLYSTAWLRHPILTSAASALAAYGISRHVADKTNTSQQNPYQL